MTAIFKLPTSDILSCKNFVGNEFKVSEGEIIDVVSPYTGKVIGYVPQSTPEEIENAVKISRWASVEWGRATYKDRASYLFKFRNLLLENIEDLSMTAASESGKTLAEARAEIMKGIEVVEYALSLQNKVQSVGALEVSNGVSCKSSRVPIGVTVGITPFNFPAMVPMWLFPISLACGNTFIWKPSEKVPLTAHKISQLMQHCGFPSGVFQTLHGAREVVENLVNSDLTNGIAFVGSSPVAKQIYSLASEKGKRSLCLGGAKNHIILVNDADEEITVQGIVDSFTGCAGQRCMAASVLLAVGDTQNLIDLITEKAASVEFLQKMGAIIDQSSHERICSMIEKAESDGAKILLDGRKMSPPEGYEGGYWIGPTIVDQAKENMDCVQKEIFGPVLTICRVADLNEAIERENRHPYGNATSVFTSSGAVAEFVCKRASNGMIGINIGVPVPREPFSFGGRKDSKFGHGDITGDGCLDFWTDLKKVTAKWGKLEQKNWMS